MSTYSVKLTKLESSHTNLRTNEIEGFCSDFPAIGLPFTMWGKGLEFGTRIIYTTQITELGSAGDYTIFKTKNSSYLLHALNGTEIAKS